MDHDLDVSLRALHVEGQLESLKMLRSSIRVLVAHFSGKKVHPNSPQAQLDAERDPNMSIAKVAVRLRSLEATLERDDQKIVHSLISEITASINVHPNWSHISVRALPRAALFNGSMCSLFILRAQLVGCMYAMCLQRGVYGPAYWTLA